MFIQFIFRFLFWLYDQTLRSARGDRVVKIKISPMLRFRTWASKQHKWSGKFIISCVSKQFWMISLNLNCFHSWTIDDCDNWKLFEQSKAHLKLRKTKNSSFDCDLLWFMLRQEKSDAIVEKKVPSKNQQNKTFFLQVSLILCLHNLQICWWVVNIHKQRLSGALSATLQKYLMQPNLDHYQRGSAMTKKVYVNRTTGTKAFISFFINI